ncbi:MAG: glycosyltransferase [Halanaerobiales bacterium]|nr:glycosyltransferase [Halanaerobiales bacterium]MCF8008311.1 glycosyltransferase [Halanaerobiales bacterium]
MKKELRLAVLLNNYKRDLDISKRTLLKKLIEKYNIKLFVLSGDIDLDIVDKNKVVYLDMDIDNSLIKFPIKYYNKINQLKEIKNRFKIDKTISFGKKANILNSLSKINEDIILNIDNVVDDSFILEKFIKRMYEKADKIVVDSKTKKNHLIAQYGLKDNSIQVIDQILSIDFISNQAAQEIEPELKDFFEDNVIVSTGELVEHKGHWHLIKAFIRIKERFKNAKLLIIGDGPLKKELDQLIKSMNFENDIKIVSNFDNKYKYIIRSDIFVLSSHLEQGKKEVLDAMSCARPIITTTCSDQIIKLVSPKNYVNNIKEPFFGEYGILVPIADNKLNINSKVLNKNEIILSDAIIKLLDDYDLYDNYMEMSAKRAIDFSADMILKEWEKLIK